MTGTRVKCVRATSNSYQSRRMAYHVSKFRSELSASDLILPLRKPGAAWSNGNSSPDAGLVAQLSLTSCSAPEHGHAYGPAMLCMTTARDVPHAGELLRAHVLQRAAPRLWKRPACLAVPTSSDPALPSQLSCSPRTMQIAEL